MTWVWKMRVTKPTNLDEMLYILAEREINSKARAMNGNLAIGIGRSN